MWGFVWSVLIYLIGGVTFLPLVLLTLVAHGWLTLPHVGGGEGEHPAQPNLIEQDDDGTNIRHGSANSDVKLRASQEREYAGYYAVSREWVPGGMSGKPPERTAHAGESVAEESPSVYQSMYRSLFDRRQGPTMDVGKPNGRVLKRSNNVFYVVLRHGHLMLYDDSEQVEVRYVISLAQHDVTVYGGGEDIPEGELWIKRNSIRLARRAALADSIEAITKPFFLFSENCSEKEDFYFALLQNQERNGNDEHPPPLVQHYETKHIIGLVQRLHSSEEQLQTRWFNALLGRLFLGVYKTQEVESFIRMKITKKIARAKKPGFLSGIVLQKIDLGDAAPFITNPRLKDLTVDGGCCVEADVKYEGKFRIEIAATARIELGSRFKAREVNFVLAIMLKKLDGHMLLKFKPPPSNRIWFTFDKMPHIDLQIEPIVSSRQITYNVILRAIESRIREVFAETLVAPHWDDSPFVDTTCQFFRGGIWVNERRDFQPSTETIVPNEVQDEPTELSSTALDINSPAPSIPVDERIQSNPSLVASESPRAGLFSRKANKSTPSLQHDNDVGSSSTVQKGTEVPKAIKSKRTSAVAGPVISTEHVNSDVSRPIVKRRPTQDAASVMSEISSRSQPSSPSVIPPTPAQVPSVPDEPNRDRAPGSSASSIRSSDGQSDKQSLKQAASDAGREILSKLESHSPSLRPENETGGARFATLAKSFTPSEKKQQSLGAAALAAKNWGWKTINKNKGPPLPPPRVDKLGTPDNPIGRGQPLPPPGQPLPHPEKRRSASIHVPPLPARKPLPPKLPARPEELPKTSASPSTTSIPTESSRPVRKSSSSMTPEDIFVVEAPTETELEQACSVEPSEDEYGEFMDNVRSDEEPEEVDSSVPKETTDGHEEVEQFQDQSITPDAIMEPAIAIEVPTPTATSRDDDSALASWKAAEEEQARSKGVWMDEPEIS